MMVPSVSKLSGTCAPAAKRALFLASAVSLSALAHAPAWPNCTSEVNILAHVPMHQAMMGLKRRPVLMASQREYSSIPPTLGRRGKKEKKGRGGGGVCVCV